MIGASPSRWCARVPKRATVLPSSAELGTHGLGADAVAAALAAYEGDWTANARGLVRRRCGPAGPMDPAARRKAGELLVRRGFRMEQVRAVLGDDGAWSD